MILKTASLMLPTAGERFGSIEADISRDLAALEAMLTERGTALRHERDRRRADRRG